MKTDRAKLFIGTRKEDRKAIYDVKKSGIPVDIFGAVTELPTPTMLYRGMFFYGIEEIEDFISTYKGSRE